MPYECTLSATCSAGPLGPSLADACSASMFVTFMSILNSLTLNNDVISGRCERVKPVEIPDDEYDFIVIGGGAAGSVVAARLSENSAWKVLILEAGPDEAAGAQIPSFSGEFLKTDIIWDYATTNESNACLATNGSCPWPQGKNLGGNTAHNGMIYLRGNPTDYNNWAEAGNEGWTWEEVEPFFIKGEDNAAEVGYNVNEDLNGDTKSGYSIVQATNKNGVRRSSSRAYLWPARNRKNLHVSLNSTVTRVIIKNDVAVGVEYYKDGELKTVSIIREVIVSAGVVESPHILLLSGLGPTKHLESVGVEVVKDLPGVGENLHDHPATLITYTINDTDVYGNDWDVATEYLTFQTGPLSGIGTTQLVGLLASNASTSDYPDIEFYIGAYTPNCGPGEVGALRSTGDRTVMVLSSYLHPKSRGRITLASNDPTELPVIWANYLGESDDVDRVVDGIRLTLAMIDTKALSGYNFTMSNSPVAACSDYEFNSDGYWACVARQNNYPLYHQGGTCKMGPSSDPMAVVDPRLRVYGIKGLRVADNSIMPQVPSCNTAAPAMMIGERVADFVKKDWAWDYSGKTTSTHTKFAQCNRWKDHCSESFSFVR